MGRTEAGGQSSTSKLIGLEALRFAAACSVLIWHYQHFAPAGQSEPGTLAGQPFHALLRPFYTYGYSGVELFWCISGFIFAWKYGEAIHAAGISFARFMTLRFSRLYPLHVVTLLVMVAGQWIYLQRHGQYFVYSVNDLKHFVLNLAFAQYWGFQDGYSFNGPSWSISAEILVYVLFFVLSRLIKPGLWPAAAIAIGVSALAFALRAAFGLKLAIFGAATFFYLGVITCHLYAMIEARPRAKRNVSAVVALLAVAVPAVQVHTGTLKIAGASLVMFPAIILVCQQLIPDTSRRLNAWVMGLGGLTYASYMLHVPLQLFAVLLIEQAGIDIERLFHAWWFFLTYLVAVFALSWLVYTGFERPAQNAIRRASLIRSKSAAAVSEVAAMDSVRLSN